MKTEMLIGREGLETLRQSRVAVFGLGGVGGYVCEALVRSGLGAFDLIDGDRVELSNLNRQLVALYSTLGRYKTDVMSERMLDISPKTNIRIYDTFFLPENSHTFTFDEYDYVVDAMDMVPAKLELIKKATEHKIPIISSMGTGNKFDASSFEIADIYETKYCPLARVMRRELKKIGIEKLNVVYSAEKPISPRSASLGTMSYVPGAAGLIIAGKVIRDLISGL